MRRFIFKLISWKHKAVSWRTDPRVHQEPRRHIRVSVSFVLKDWKFMFFSMFSGVEKTFWSQKCLIVLRYHHTEIRRKASWSNLLDPAPRLIASNLYFDLSVSQKKPPHCPNKPPHPKNEDREPIRQISDTISKIKRDSDGKRHALFWSLWTNIRQLNTESGVTSHRRCVFFSCKSGEWLLVLFLWKCVPSIVLSWRRRIPSSQRSALSITK